MINTLRNIKKLLIISTCFIIIGCTSSANIQNATVDDTYNLKFNSELVGKIGVTYVNGASRTSDLYNLGLTNREFKTALKASLQNQYLLAIENLPSFILTASFLDIDYPSFGSDLYFESKIRYVLVKKTTNEVVFDSVITSTGQASISDALIASSRLKIAAERSANNNIKDFLTKLSSAL